jgi:hypothetical protein
MKPLGEDFLELKSWAEALPDHNNEGLTVGFLVDSPLGALKKSGLILRPESVVELDQTLTNNNARIFYADPRRSTPAVYKKMVQSFDQFLNETNLINFELSPPYLLLGKKTGNHFKDFCLLEYDSRISCMWFLQTRELLLNCFDEKKEIRQDPKIQTFIKRCAGTIRDESMKDFASKLVGLLSSTAGAVFQ